MILIYYPLILFSILGYGFFASKKILSINSKNLGYQGIVGIFSLLIISYFSSQFFPHGKIFNLIILIVGLYFFLFYFKKIKFKIFDFYLLLFLILFYFVFIFISKKS